MNNICDLPLEYRVTTLKLGTCPACNNNVEHIETGYECQYTSCSLTYDSDGYIPSEKAITPSEGVTPWIPSEKAITPSEGVTPWIAFEEPKTKSVGITIWDIEKKRNILCNEWRKMPLCYKLENFCASDVNLEDAYLMKMSEIGEYAINFEYKHRGSNEYDYMKDCSQIKWKSTRFTGFAIPNFKSKYFRLTGSEIETDTSAARAARTDMNKCIARLMKSGE